MFKLLVLASLLAVAMAAPADVVATKQADSSVVVNKNDPYNPNDDTVTKKQSVSETVTKTDASYPPGFDKNTAAAIQSMYGIYGFNPLLANPFGYSNLYNLYNPYSNFGYNPFYPAYNPFNPAYNFKSSFYSPSYYSGPKY